MEGILIFPNVHFLKICKMKREREQLNRVYVVIAGMDLVEQVGSFLFTDEEMASLKPFQMSIPSEREEAVAKGDSDVLRKNRGICALRGARKTSRIHHT